MNNTDQEKWHQLLSKWKFDLIAVWNKHEKRWGELGLPDTNGLTLRDVDHNQQTYPELSDKEVLKFYSVTNGWPLWLGSLGVGILPINEIGFFSELYKDAYETASTHALEERITGSDAALSKLDLREAVVLSGPDAREFVLSLKTGETVFYHFDGMSIFENFYVYMKHQQQVVVADFSDILEET